MTSKPLRASEQILSQLTGGQDDSATFVSALGKGESLEDEGAGRIVQQWYGVDFRILVVWYFPAATDHRQNRKITDHFSREIELRSNAGGFALNINSATDGDTRE